MAGCPWADFFNMTGLNCARSIQKHCVLDKCFIKSRLIAKNGTMQPMSTGYKLSAAEGPSGFCQTCTHFMPQSLSSFHHFMYFKFLICT